MPPGVYDRDGFKEGPNGGIFADPTAKLTDNKDFESWDWKQVRAAVVGYSAAPASAVPATTPSFADPNSIRNASTVFNRAYMSLQYVSNNLRLQTEALAGENGAWKSPASEAFRGMNLLFAAKLKAKSEQINGGEFVGTNNVPAQLWESGNYLEWAQRTIEYIDGYYAEYVRSVGVTMGNGLARVSDYPELVAQMGEDMKKVVRILASQYTLVTSNVTPPNPSDFAVKPKLPGGDGPPDLKPPPGAGGPDDPPKQSGMTIEGPKIIPKPPEINGPPVGGDGPGGGGGNPPPLNIGGPPPGGGAGAGGGGGGNPPPLNIGGPPPGGGAGAGGGGGGGNPFVARAVSNPAPVNVGDGPGGGGPGGGAGGGTPDIKLPPAVGVGGPPGGGTGGGGTGGGGNNPAVKLPLPPALGVNAPPGGGAGGGTNPAIKLPPAVGVGNPPGGGAGGGTPGIKLPPALAVNGPPGGGTGGGGTGGGGTGGGGTGGTGDLKPPPALDVNGPGGVGGGTGTGDGGVVKPPLPNPADWQAPGSGGSGAPGGDKGGGGMPMMPPPGGMGGGQPGGSGGDRPDSSGLLGGVKKPWEAGSPLPVGDPGLSKPPVGKPEGWAALPPPLNISAPGGGTGGGGTGGGAGEVKPPPALDVNGPGGVGGGTGTGDGTAKPVLPNPAEWQAPGSGSSGSGGAGGASSPPMMPPPGGMGGGQPGGSGNERPDSSGLLGGVKKPWEAGSPLPVGGPSEVAPPLVKPEGWAALPPALGISAPPGGAGGSTGGGAGEVKPPPALDVNGPGGVGGGTGTGDGTAKPVLPNPAEWQAPGSGSSGSGGAGGASSPPMMPPPGGMGGGQPGGSGSERPDSSGLLGGEKKPWESVTPPVIGDPSGGVRPPLAKPEDWAATLPGVQVPGGVGGVGGGKESLPSPVDVKVPGGGSAETPSGVQVPGGGLPPADGLAGSVLPPLGLATPPGAATPGQQAPGGGAPMMPPPGGAGAGQPGGGAERPDSSGLLGGVNEPWTGSGDVGKVGGDSDLMPPSAKPESWATTSDGSATAPPVSQSGPPMMPPPTVPGNPSAGAERSGSSALLGDTGSWEPALPPVGTDQAVATPAAPSAPWAVTPDEQVVALPSDTEPVPALPAETVLDPQVGEVPPAETAPVVGEVPSETPAEVVTPEVETPEAVTPEIAEPVEEIDLAPAAAPAGWAASSDVVPSSPGGPSTAAVAAVLGASAVTAAIAFGATTPFVPGASSAGTTPPGTNGNGTNGNGSSQPHGTEFPHVDGDGDVEDDRDDDRAGAGPVPGVDSVAVVRPDDGVPNTSAWDTGTADFLLPGMLVPFVVSKSDQSSWDTEETTPDIVLKSTEPWESEQGIEHATYRRRKAGEAMTVVDSFVIPPTCGDEYSVSVDDREEYLESLDKPQPEGDEDPDAEPEEKSAADLLNESGSAWGDAPVSRQSGVLE